MAIALLIAGGDFAADDLSLDDKLRSLSIKREPYQRGPAPSIRRGSDRQGTGQLTPVRRHASRGPVRLVWCHGDAGAEDKPAR